MKLNPHWVLRDFLMKTGLTQSEMAHRSGLPQPLISQLCAGVRGFTEKTAGALAPVIGCDSSVLFTKPNSNTIIKYPKNRKLYDPSFASYITLRDFVTRLSQNENVRVHCAKTGADLTIGCIYEWAAAYKAAPETVIALLEKVGR